MDLAEKASQAWLKLRSLRSEQAGALFSYAGTLGVSLTRDADSVAATGICLVGETMYLVPRGAARAAWQNLKEGNVKALLHGQKPEGFRPKEGDEKTLAESALGYSVSYLFFMASNYEIFRSQATAGSNPLRATVMATTAMWTLALLRYPAEKLAEKLQESRPKAAERLQNYADNVKYFVSGASSLSRLPALFFSVRDGKEIMAACTALWGTSELLIGRVQDKVKEGAVAVRQKVEGFAQNPRETDGLRTLIVKEALRDVLHLPAPAVPEGASCALRR
ncbi:MAG: hypothetical protein PW734_06000 [Verrucomicrobium sp.]|nr:hypothetical protein [Verrucomicrobium sp.]